MSWPAWGSAGWVASLAGCVRAAGAAGVAVARDAGEAACREAGVAAPFVERASSRAVAASSSEGRSEEHTSELQSLMRISYAVFCLKKKNKTHVYTEPYKHTQQNYQYYT